MPKILIIRLSSIGDIIQCMGVVGGIKKKFPDAEIHWVVRSDMQQTLSIDKRIDKIWCVEKSEGFKGLLKLSKTLKKEKFDYVYEANSNIRAKVIKNVIKFSLGCKAKFATRRKERLKRILLFKFGINKFPNPFVAVESYRAPLRKWGVVDFNDDFKDYHFPNQLEAELKDIVTEKTVTLVPSANFDMKRWPVEHFQRLIELLPEYNFVVLGGPTDTFREDIRSVAPSRVVNLAGKSSIMGSSYIVSLSKIVISGDTGFLHSADMFGVPAIALMGPTAFGYPYRESSCIMSLNLKCMPCSKSGRGGCKDKVYKRCMVDITPEMVAEKISEIL